jgi:hypothetical protein
MHERVPADVALARIMREAPAMSIKDQLTLIADRAKALSTEALDIAAGKSARVISKFNGQPFGLSRKPLTAKVLTITCVYVDANCGRVTFWSENAPDAGFGMEDVEFLEDQA